MGSERIVIEMKSAPERDKYSVFFSEKGPIYFPGDLVEGSFSIISDEDNFKYKEIVISMVGRYYCKKAFRQEFTLQLIKIEPGILQSGQKIPFKFENVQLPSPSYIGIEYKLCYFINIHITMPIFSLDLSAEQYIIFIEPESNYIPSKPAQITLNDGYPICQVLFDKGNFANNENITGRILFGETENLHIKKMKIYLDIIEIYNQSITEQNITKYQLTDGCPPPGANIPFMIQLNQFLLPALRKERNSKLYAQIRARLKVRMTDGRTISSSQNIQLYQASLD